MLSIAWLAATAPAASLFVQEPETEGVQASAAVVSEDTYYKVDYFTPPEGEILEVGGMDWLPDGRLLLSTRRGQVWAVENALADDPAQASFHLFADGLQEGLGLKVVDGQVYVVQRGELSRLIDGDGDGYAEAIETVTNDWGMSGNYHEFAFGLPVDASGHFYVGLNVSFFSKTWWLGNSTVPYRGWLLRISPEGEVKPFASGFRSPAGVAMDDEGRVYVTDNQGDWVASSPIYHVEEGKFYGHPASLSWTPEYLSSGTVPSTTYPPARGTEDRTDPAIWIPYGWSRSTGNLVPDTTGGRFGPFEKQLFVAELTNGMVLRAQMEEVRGIVQGAILPHRQGIGSVSRVLFSPDGSLFCGMTNRGWGGLAPGDGLARVRWTGELPMEVDQISLRDHGFALTFTQPLAADQVLDPAAVRAVSYDYDYWWEYGSPERDTQPIEVKALVPMNSGKELLVLTEPLEAGRVVRLGLGKLRSEQGDVLVHDEFAYTIRQLPNGPRNTANIAKVVPPPPGRGSSEEGWLRLTYGDATNVWQAEGWTLCDAEIDTTSPTAFRTREGNGALVPEASAGDMTSNLLLGDSIVQAEFMLPEDGRGVLWLNGNYGIELAHGAGLGARTVGSLMMPFGKVEPGFGAYRGPGQWHDLEVRFRAPRFDANGAKIEPARIEQLSIDGTVLHEDAIFEQPSVGCPIPSENVRGPLIFSGSTGLYALRGVRAKPLDMSPFPGSKESSEEGWTRLFEGDEEDLEGWEIRGEGLWTLEDDVLMGEGLMGHIFSPRGDYENFEVRAKIKIADGGNSGLYVRAALGDGWPKGYEAQINSNYPDPQKTGSLYNLAKVTTHLIPQDTWFDYHVLCKDEEGGTRITIRVNDIVTADYLDRERLHGKGHIAFQQHHDGSVVEITDAWVREL